MDAASMAFYVFSISAEGENFTGVILYEMPTLLTQNKWLDNFLKMVKGGANLTHIDNKKIRINFISMLPSKMNYLDTPDVWRSVKNIMNPDEIDTGASPYKDDKVNQFILLGLSHLRNAGKFFVSIDVRNILSELLLKIAEDYRNVVGVELDYYALDDPHKSLFDDYFDVDKIAERAKRDEEAEKLRRRDKKE